MAKALVDLKNYNFQSDKISVDYTTIIDTGVQLSGNILSTNFPITATQVNTFIKNAIISDAQKVLRITLVAADIILLGGAV